ncbi:MAG TPA: ATP-binding protein, partial [Deltaproteobacteria bacterium]|nr:ATP-binding protein [Deltaproteobacteria bacterium]
MIMGNPAHLHQIMMSLFTNAVHAMNDSTGEIEVSIEKVRIDGVAAGADLDLPAGPYLKLSVRDSGRGMTPRVLTRVFDPYFTTTRKGYGAGLGLSVVHGIVKSHGGAICCKSSPDKGATFEIYFPQIEHTDDQARVSAMTTPMPKPRKLALVEDGRTGISEQSRAAGVKRLSGKVAK